MGTGVLGWEVLGREPRWSPPVVRTQGRRAQGPRLPFRAVLRRAGGVRADAEVPEYGVHVHVLHGVRAEDHRLRGAGTCPGPWAPRLRPGCPPQRGLGGLLARSWGSPGSRAHVTWQRPGSWAQGAPGVCEPGLARPPQCGPWVLAPLPGQGPSGCPSWRGPHCLSFSLELFPRRLECL